MQVIKLHLSEVDVLALSRKLCGRKVNNMNKRTTISHTQLWKSVQWAHERR